MQITKDRWSKLLSEMEVVLHRYVTDGYESDVKEDEINLVINTLKTILHLKWLIVYVERMGMKTVEQIKSSIEDLEEKLLQIKDSDLSSGERIVFDIINQACVDTLKWVIEDEN